MNDKLFFVGWITFFSLLISAVISYAYMAESHECMIQGKNLFKDAKCAVNQVYDSYNYNKSNLRTTLTDEELMSLGGVCWHYADYYERKGLLYGYNASRINFFGHAVAVWEKNDCGYVLIDGFRSESFYYAEKRCSE